MNAKDLIAAIEVHAATHGTEPIYLDAPVWHAAKQTFLLNYGEGSMFPVAGYADNFGWRGVPVVLDSDGLGAKSDAATAIAALALVSGPQTDPLALHSGHPEANVVEGQPRPELDGQVAIEHFAGEDGVFAAPKAEEVKADRGDVLDGGSAPGPDGTAEKTDGITGPKANDPTALAPEPRTADTAPEPTGFAAMSKQADQPASDGTAPVDPSPKDDAAAPDAKKGKDAK